MLEHNTFCLCISKYMYMYSTLYLREYAYTVHGACVHSTVPHIKYASIMLETYKFYALFFHVHTYGTGMKHAYSMHEISRGGHRNVPCTSFHL